MKIHPVLTVIQGQKSSSARRAEQRSEGQSGAGSGAEVVSGQSVQDVVEVVSLENVRASAAAPPKDLGEAEQVLEKITRDLGGLSRSDLRNLHRLEGLVHFFSA